MSVSTLSTSAQNYLKVVWGLGEWSTDPVTASQVAAKAGVKLSTASDAIRKLTDQGLIKHTPYGSVSLTAEGRQHAVAMVRRHRLIETFLVKTLEFRWDQVHDEAETLEHAVSDFMIDRIDQLLGHPTRDPHGDPIPRGDGSVDMPAAVTLAATTPGSVRIERISDEDPELLQFFAERGIAIGDIVTVVDGAAFSDSRELHRDGAAPVNLGPSVTSSVWITRLP